MNFTNVESFLRIKIFDSSIEFKGVFVFKINEFLNDKTLPVLLSIDNVSASLKFFNLEVNLF